MSTERRYASRKFALTAAAVAIATGFRIADLLDGAEWIQITTWLAGLYMAGNVGATAATALSATISTKRSEKPQ